MKLLAAVFASIALLAALLGFGTNAIPILCTLGKITAVIALAGFVVTALAHATEVGHRWSNSKRATNMCKN